MKAPLSSKEFNKGRWFWLIIALSICPAVSPMCSASPADLKAIEIKKTGSIVVLIGRTRLGQEGDKLKLEGHVLRNSGHADTGHSHLVITIIGAAEEVLREIHVDFTPQQIPHGVRMLGSSKFSVVIGDAPKTIRRIEIKAYERE